MFRKAFVVAAIGILTTGCAGRAPDCSALNIKVTVVQLAKQRVAQQVAGNPAMRMFFNAASSQYQLNGIRTVEGNRNSCSCKASLNIAFDFTDDVKRWKDTKPEDWAKVSTSPVVAGMAREIDLDVTYHVERTDDGKDFYVTLEGL